MAAMILGGSDDTLRGIGLRVLSGVFFVGMVSSVKLASPSVPLGQIVFFRSAFALLPLVVFLLWRQEFPAGLRTERPFGHLARSMLGGIAMFTSFAAITRLSVAEAVLLSYLTPIILSLLAVRLLGERLTPARAAGLVLGISGVAIFVAPDLLAEIGRDAAALDLRRLSGIGLSLLTALLTAGALVQIRKLAATESAGAIAFWFAVATSLGGLATWPLGWVWPTPEAAVFLVLAGLTGGFGHIAMTLSFKYAEASAMAPFEYLTLVWTILLDWLVFRSPPGASFLLAVPFLLGASAITFAAGARLQFRRKRR
ncbi:DMT family transporter [Paracoccus sp. J39]|uniref:DMT family transporter n=1 Tax=Paracoccus sp. J39 TaxID=935848 RepID=UPI00048DCCAD|nr:DMT family transporter [Paracoccus sp. J39]